MKHRLLLLLLLLAAWGARAQTVLQQESFETDGAGVRYTTNGFNANTVGGTATQNHNQYFQRVTQTSSNVDPPPNTLASNGSANASWYSLPVSGGLLAGSYFFAGEGVRGPGNTLTRDPGTVTLSSVSIAGKTNLQVQVAMLDGRGTNVNWSPNSNTARSLISIQVNIDNSGWTTIGQFAASSGSQFSGISLDTDKDGVGDGTALTTTFRDFTFAVRSSGNSMQTRVVADVNGLSTEFGFDNIRVLGTAATGVAPVVSAIESTTLNYAEGSGFANITSTLTVSDSDSPNLTGATVQFTGNGLFDSSEDELTFSTQPGITGSYSTSTGTGVLTLSGTASVAAYQAALRSVTYRNSDAANATAGNRVVSFQVTDNSNLTSGSVTRTVAVTTALNAAGGLPYAEDLETDGEGTRYASNRTSANLTAGRAFVRTSTPSEPGGQWHSNGSAATTISGINTANYWWASGTNVLSGGVGTFITQQINTAGYSNLNFSVKLAASNNVWESTQYVKVYYRLGGSSGTWTPLISFRSTDQSGVGTSITGNLARDNDPAATTGIPTGSAQLTPTLTTYSAALPASANGQLVDLKIDALSRFSDGVGEVIAFDNLQLTGTPPTTVNSLVRASTNPTNAATVNYTLTFGSPVTGLTASNFTLTTTGTVSGPSVGTPVSTGTGSTWTVPVTTGTGSGTLTLNLANASNLSPSVSTTLPFAGDTYTIDKTAPTAVISSATAASGSTSSAATFAYTVTFSESVTGFAAGDVAVGNGALSGFTGSGTTYIFNVTPTANGAVTVNVAANVAVDAVGNGNTAASQYSITYAAPNVTVTSVTRLNPSPTATTQVFYQVVFSGNVMDLTVSNFATTVTSGSITGAGINSVVGSGTTYRVGVSTGNTTSDGTLRLDMVNSTNVSPTVTNVPYNSGEQYTITKSFAAAPTLRIQAAGSATGNSDVTAFVDVVQVLNTVTNTVVANGMQNGSFETNNVSPSDYLYQSQGVSASPWTFGIQAGITRNNSAFGSTAANGDAVAFLQSRTNPSANGNVSQNLAVPSGSYQVSFRAIQRNYTSLDQVLNVFVNDVFVGTIQPNNTPTYDTFTSATFSVTAPTLTATISSTAGASGSTTATSPLPFTVTFSQSVTGFVASDVIVVGGTLTGFSGSGTTYTFNVLPSASGTVTVNVPANGAVDSNNTGNTAATPFSLIYAQPLTPTPAVLTPATGSYLATTTPAYKGTALTSSIVTVYVDNAAIGTTTADASGNWTFTQPTALPLSQGSHPVYATAQASGSSVSADSDANTFTVDTVPPMVTLSSTVASGNSTSTSPVNFTATFTESVRNFNSAGIQVSGGTVTSGPTAGSGNSYTFQVTPGGAGTVAVAVLANAASDRAGNFSTASSQYAFTFIVPTIVVTPTTLPKGTTNMAYSQTIAASGGIAPYSYAITLGALPAGLTLASNGVLTGTPTADGFFNFTVTATDASAAPGPASGSRAYALTITYPDLVISTGGQTIPAGTYNSITVQRDGEGTLAGPVTVSGDVTVQSGGVLQDGCELISGAGSFTLAPGGTLGICSPQGISSSGATGTIQVTGTRSFSTDAVYSYTGTGAQVTGPGLPATVRTLVLLNPAGLSLTNDLTTTVAAIFTSGVLTTGAFRLTLGSGATLSEDADGYVTGTVQATRTLATAGSPEAFGGLGLMLTPSGSTLPGSTVVTRVTGTALRGAGSSTSTKRYFDIEPAINTGLNVALLLTARDDERNGIAPANLRLFKSADNGSSWQQQPAAYNTTTISGLTTYSASLSGISDFSLWTLGDAAAPLPVTLISFKALLQDENRALLRWATAFELHSAYFAVERSLDGRTFIEVGRVAAAGTSLSAHTYELRDPLPLMGTTYYRLRQVDADKSAAYSPIVILTPSTQPVVAIRVYPNPRIGMVSTSLGLQGLPNQVLTVQVTNMLGRTVSTQQFTPATSQDAMSLNLPASLAAGVYSISVSAGKQMWTTRLVVAP